MAEPLSVYVLTFNSQRRLGQVLAAARLIADELVVLDSGSSDATLDIAAACGARIVYRKFENFRDQRVFGEEQCTHRWILALDSDEVPSDELVAELQSLKANDFVSPDGRRPEGFSIRRDWYFLGRKVRNFYPVRTPEYVVRLFRKDKISAKGSRIIHEIMQYDAEKISEITQPINHYSCDTIDDLYLKMPLYTSLSAKDMYDGGKRASWLNVNVFPWLIWFRWYVVNGSWRDGEAGLILARYARITVYLKYLKLRHYPDASRG